MSRWGFRMDVPAGGGLISPARWLKSLLPQGLLGRSLTILVTPLVLVQLVSALVFYTNHWESVSKRLAFGVAGDLRAVVDLYRLFPEPERRTQIGLIAANRLEMGITFEPDGILANIRQPRPAGQTETALYRALTERVQRPFQVDTGSSRRFILVRIQLADGVMEAAVAKKRLFSYTAWLYLAWVAGTSMLMMAVATIFMRNQVRSVRRLAVAADRFGKGLDVPMFKPEGATEVRQAAQAFLIMRERIGRQIQQRTSMLAGVSHDLRTPLTRMKLQLALMEGADGVKDLAEDVAEMEKMIEGYLAFARGEGTETPVPGDLAQLVADVVARYRREGHAIAFADSLPVPLTMRPHALGRAIGNVVGNAVRYGTSVAVSLSVSESGHVADIRVDDDGPGIPPAMREEVFKPFRRLEESRNTETGGTGLGLAIALDAVRGHGGDITLGASSLGGLGVCIRLPL